MMQMQFEYVEFGERVYGDWFSLDLYNQIWSLPGKRVVSVRFRTLENRVKADMPPYGPESDATGLDPLPGMVIPPNLS